MKVSTLQASLLAITFAVLSGGFTAIAQAQAQAPPASVPANQAPAAQTPAPQVAAQTPAPRPSPKVPDYPDPRTLTVGVFYFLTQPSKGPDIIGGSQATTYETLDDLGKGKGAPGIEVSYPVTRTGVVIADFWISKGDGDETTTLQTSPFSNTYLAGTPIATSYKIDHGRIYLDDLLWPHLFPVPKFRLKSIWAFQYTKISSTVDTPGVEQITEPNGALVGGPISGGHTLLDPEFGLAAEYAIAPHVLLRADGAGFGIPHKADVWEANVTLAVRVNHAEVVIGGKALHFKTSPNSTEYLVGTVDGAFAEVRWHF